MNRPESAFARSKSKHSGNGTLSSLNNQSFNTSNNAIVRIQNVENLQEVSEHMQEIKSQQPNSKNKKQINKLQLVEMLMKLQLQKMGFAGTREQKLVRQFLNKENIQQIQVRHLKRWVLSTKSQIVQILLKQPNLSEQNSQISSMRSKTINFRSNNMRLNTNQHHQIMQENNNARLVQTNILKIQAQNRGKQQKKVPIKKILCPICLQQTSEYIQRVCRHIFCNLCFQNYILENISIGNYIIDCAEYDCNQKVSQQQAAKVLEPKDLEKFVKFKLKIQLEMNPNNKFCNKPDCGHLLTQTEDKKLQCKKCKIVFCQICQETDHPGQACNEIANEALKNTYSQFKIKKCPNCGSPIQKINGCNHMICKKCKCEFCWICLQHYTPYHYRIYNCCGCPGLQFEEIENLNYKRFLQAMFFIFFPILFIIWIVAAIGLLPFYMLFNLFIKPLDWLQDTSNKCEIELLNALCYEFPNCCFNIIGYILLVPRSIIYTIFVSPIKYVGLVINFVQSVI